MCDTVPSSIVAAMSAPVPSPLMAPMVLVARPPSTGAPGPPPPSTIVYRTIPSPPVAVMAKPIPSPFVAPISHPPSTGAQEPIAGVAVDVATTPAKETTITAEKNGIVSSVEIKGRVEGETNTIIPVHGTVSILSSHARGCENPSRARDHDYPSFPYSSPWASFVW